MPARRPIIGAAAMRPSIVRSFDRELMIPALISAIARNLSANSVRCVHSHCGRPVSGFITSVHPSEDQSFIVVFQ